ncbi:uncharacterized protein LOC132303113 [Cornus florida]|uniref:uncharacterized protein LOC132303113 n=1 Tax=Cornus florida TaxID=4283 RepID=UPI00289CFB28|nr:uncharacterized protein LOC132303113 [Cornus florida]
MENESGILENLMGGQHKSSNNFFMKSINFFNNKKRDDDEFAKNSPKPLTFLSSFANSVVFRCSKILLIPTEELQHRFDTELPDTVKQPSTYARNFLEFCSYQALHLVTGRPDYFSDKEFRQLTYDMMLAWEAPGVESELLDKETASFHNQEAEDEDRWSLFYSNPTNMAVQVDDKKTVGPEAFARIAPACALVADIITVHNLFDILTSSSGHRLHFLIYDKYLRNLEKVIKGAKNALGPQLLSNLKLDEGEIILDVDGTVPTQPVLQHIGISAWPGRLILTNYALYFESLGVGLYEKAVRYDLAMDMKQVIKPELTGPLGARLFDKAVMYKSISVAEPVYFEFPEFKGNSRRDYWLDICLEVLRAHKFIRKYNLKGTQQSEALARAILGIFRCRAVREAFHIFSSHYRTLLCFNLAESLPGGDTILGTLSSRLALLNARTSRDNSVGANGKQGLMFPVSLLTLCRLGLILHKEGIVDGEAIVPAADVCVGETNPLEVAVKQSKCETGRAEAAQATVDQVKVEGIDTNLAVMKELLFPLIESLHCLQLLASWEEPSKSTVFLVLVSYMTYRGWIRYILPFIFLVLAVLMLWRRHANKGGPLEAFKIIAPPNKNAVEQLLTLQEAITQVEGLIQAGNITLLKLRALLFAALPQATDKLALLLVLMAVLLALVPLKYLILLIFLEAFTREMPLRKESSDRWLRRVREWWIRIPAAPVQLIKPDDKKRK